MGKLDRVNIHLPDSVDIPYLTELSKSPRKDQGRIVGRLIAMGLLAERQLSDDGVVYSDVINLRQMLETRSFDEAYLQYIKLAQMPQESTK